MSSNERRGYITILHISDLHFGAEDVSRRQTLQSDTALLKPDIICVTGDVANWPRKRHYEAAREFLRGLSNILTTDGEQPRLYVVPGNHDAFLGLRKFRKHLIRPLLNQENVAFAELIRIRDQPISIFGLNSTWFSKVPNLQNKGRVTERRLAEFKSEIADLRHQHGDEYDRSRKIVLLHHHPIPTVVKRSNEDRFESMLFLQNAGKVLTEMANNGISIILHGHQHQPCDFSLDYNVGAGATMTILSAGTTLKSVPDSNYYKAQYYVLRLYGDRVYIESRNYYREPGERVGRFLPTKSGMRELGREPMAECELKRVYEITPTRALRENGEMRARATAGHTVNECRIGFGVDENTTPVAPTDDCGLRVWRKNVAVEPKLIRFLRHEPREKLVEVTLDPPLDSGVGETISWTYEWPGGWTRLLDDSRDTGSYYVDRKLSKLSIQVKSQVKELQVAVKVFALPDWKTKLLEGGFEIETPPFAHRIDYEIQVSRNSS
jgi:3',5'-cyclic AMP phosphodiesterase CpdA